MSAARGSRERQLRLLRWIWRAYPGRWRRRYGEELEHHLQDLIGSGSGAPPGAVAVIWDALCTLPLAWLDELRRTPVGPAWSADIQSAWRGVSRTKRHAALVVATLALALGANAAVFSVAWSVLVESLPYAEPERLATVEPPPVAMRDMTTWTVSEELLAMPGIEGASVYVPDGGANFVGAGDAARLSLAHVDDAFFALLGVEPVLGRVPESGSGDLEAVLSNALWRDAFGGTSDVLGRTIDLSGHTARVVGVAPTRMDFPAGTDLWVSMPVVLDFYALAAGASVLARVRAPDVLPALQAARREDLARSFESLPDHLPRPESRVTPLERELLGSVHGPLLALFGAAIAVVLLGCVNLAGIEVARMARRTDELELRRVLGAGRARLFVQLAAETAILAAASGVVALAVAGVGGRVLAAWLPPDTPGASDVGLDPAVVLFTGGATLLAALTIGTFPAWRGARRVVGTGGGRTSSPDRRRNRLQDVLIVAQVSLAVVLALGAGLLGQSLVTLGAVPLGYDTRSVLTFRVHLPSHAYPDAVAQAAWVERVQAGLTAIPGVTAVGVGTRLPFGSGMGVGLGLLPDDAGPETERVSTSWLRVSAGYFDAMGIRLLAGTPPTPPSGEEGDQGGIVLGRSAAARLFGDRTAIGRQVSVAGGSGPPMTVVGVAEDVRLRGREGAPQPVAFGSDRGAWMASPAFAMRVEGDLADVVQAVRSVLTIVDPTTPADELRTTREAASEELAARRALAALTAIFGVAALLLVGLGVYGVIGAWVQGRRKELGIRMALGAPARRVMVLTVARALALVSVGLAVGLPAALLASRSLRSMLYGVSPSEPGVVATVIALVLAVGAAASFAPAFRAGRIHPAESLRAQ